MNRDVSHSAPLSGSELKRYQEMGVLFPIPVLSLEEQRRFRNAIDEFVALSDTSAKPANVGQCHLNFEFAYDLSTHQRILDAVEQVIGPNILVHSSTIFSKHPGRSFVSWHQDSVYWHLSAPRLVSAWIALSESTVENGCMRVQPGSHLRQREHAEIRHEDNMLGTGSTVKGGPDGASTVNVVLRAGEMSLHHANLLHGSDPNRSNHNRIGFAVRYLAPDVHQGREHHEVILARGHDRYQHFQHLKNPPVYSVRDGMQLHFAFSTSLNKRDLDRRGPRVTSN